MITLIWTTDSSKKELSFSPKLTGNNNNSYPILFLEGFSLKPDNPLMARLKSLR
jgi:hypothetical protein